MSICEKIAVWLNPFFPLTKALLANSNLKTQIEDIEQEIDNTPYVENFRNIDYADVNMLHENTLDYRKSLTDKAKNNVFGITLAVTFIVGMTRVFISVDCPQNLISLLLLAEIATIMALIYMISGGLVSLYTLQGQRIYDLTPEDFSYLKTIDDEKVTQERVFLIARNMELNIKVNLIINNMVSASYGFLRNGLICLLLSTLFVCAISYIKIPIEKTLVDEINPIIKNSVSAAFDNLKSGQIMRNEKVVSIIKENKQELKKIQTALSSIRADVKAIDRSINKKYIDK